MASKKRITFQPAGINITAETGENLLNAARRHGLAVRFGCRNGVCDLCQASLIAGTLWDSRADEVRTPPATFNLCRVEALSDLDIKAEEIMGAGQLPTLNVRCRVLDVTPISDDVSRVRLELPAHPVVRFHAGQYLAIELPGAEPAYFSIASAPAARELELHIQAGEDWDTAQNILDYLRRHGAVPVTLPYGKACLGQVPAQPVVLIAAGTGFAQMKSVVEYLRANETVQPVVLYWGVRRLEDMYLRAMPEQWQSDWASFTFVPVVKDDEDNDWRGHHEQLVKAVLAAGHDWSNTLAMVSGSPAMVYTLMDALLAAGMPAEHFLSDVLEYAPRD
ncbi:2Fe-2S iron-sulfur cluster-binding protein [Mangrovitalea sediminis]|uniref:2Fe-2S iron-sulfur cluster-binding protein n=1 Tax=Mangrovitalea sediminis TaxID=1982043 RepID=UPI000BE55A68|nr:2Fe-2S iron-sulfur cluster-binding protein [Mangrovitalea sediminis]